MEGSSILLEMLVLNVNHITYSYLMVLADYSDLQLPPLPRSLLIKRYDLSSAHSILVCSVLIELCDELFACPKLSISNTGLICDIVAIKTLCRCRYCANNN